MHGMDQLHEDLGRPEWFWPAVNAALLFLLVSAWALAMTADEISELQDTQEAQREAIEHAQREQRREQAAQEMCGGENAVAVDLGNGWHQCKTKRNFNTQKVRLP